MPPIRIYNQVQAIIDGGVAEGLHLEFKSGPVPWPDKEDGTTPGLEAAKDVAAFANTLGGTILAGVTESKSGVASGLSPIKNGGRLRDHLSAWLGQYLEPREVASTVELQPIPVDGGCVLAINVPAWAGPPVAVGWTKGEGVMRFPIRREAITSVMSPNEVFGRAEAASRRTFLQLQALRLAHQLVDVRIESTVGAGWPPLLVDLRPPVGVRHGWVVGLDEDTLALGMVGADTAKAAHAMSRRLATALGPSHMTLDNVAGLRASFQTELSARTDWEEIGNLGLAIPLPYIQDLWITKPKSGNTPMLHLDLRADVVFEGKEWLIALRR